MTYQNILTEKIDKVAMITLNRPEKLNAMSYELARELDAELTKLESDDTVSAVVLTGAGPRAFSAGGDIHQMAKSSDEELVARTEFRTQANWRIATFAKPIIGAINGLAYGAGAQLTSASVVRSPSFASWQRGMEGSTHLGRCRWWWVSPKRKSCSTPDEWFRPLRLRRSGSSIRSCPAPNCSLKQLTWPN
jgi:hypothetical protein